MARDVPSVIRREPHLIDLAIPIEPGVTRYRILGSQTLNGAYGNAHGVPGPAVPTTILEAQSGEYFRSPSVRRRRPSPIVEESFRNQTRIMFDIMDYQGPGNPLPVDDQPLFLRMQKFHVATGAFLPQGPILIVPAPGFFNTRYPSFSCSGSAPGILCQFGGVMPADALHIVFTAAVSAITFENLNAATSMMISFNKKMTTMELAGAGLFTHNGELDEILFGSPLNNVAINFSFAARFVNAG